MESRINKKEVTKIARTRLAEGISKQVVYDELVGEYKFRNEIAEILAGIPSAARNKKYGPLNMALLTFLIIITTLSLVHPSPAIIWPIWLIYVVAFKRIRWYYWNTWLGAIILIGGIGICIYERQANLNVIALTGFVSAVLILAGIGLPRLLAPAYKEVREEGPDGAGEQRFYIRHQFVD